MKLRSEVLTSPHLKEDGSCGEMLDHVRLHTNTHTYTTLTHKLTNTLTHKRTNTHTHKCTNTHTYIYVCLLRDCVFPCVQPLNPDPTSTWRRYFEDNEVLLQIDFDSRRLYPDMSFFQLATPYPQVEYKTGTILNIDALKSRVDRTTLTAHQVAMSRGGVRNMVR